MLRDAGEKVGGGEDLEIPVDLGAKSLMMLLPSRMVWSRLVRRLPRAAVLIQRLSWQIWMASALRSTP